MIEIKNVPTVMVKAASRLKLGALLIVYRDETAVRCEMENGRDPYVWRKGKWRQMHEPRKRRKHRR